MGWFAAAWFPGGASHQEIVLEAAPSGGDFTLNSPAGRFDLRDQRGKVVLLYFGYTFCPDICPTSLALMSQALNAMSSEESERVQGLFISVDPGRDTLEKLKEYTAHFHPAILGVTGSPKEVALVARQYGAAYAKVEGESQGGYLVDHSSVTSVIAPDGRLYANLSHGTPPQEILRVIRELFSGE